MYYKLLNKTVLTSALISLICVAANQTSAQELFNADEKTKVELPNPKNVSIEIEDEIIPLANEGLITPEPVVAKKEKKKSATAKQADDFADDFDISFEDPKPAPKPSVKKPEAAPKSEVKNAEKPLPAQAENRKQSVAQNRPQDKRNVANAPTPQTAPVAENPDSKQPAQSDVKFGDSILAQTNNDLFNQMSDIEKQTTLLTLELKREKIRNEVEAAKAVRERAEQEKIAVQEAKARKEAEWEKEQEIKVIKAQEELKQKEIELEKLKQRKALTAYMNSMLEQKQAWIDENSKLYDEIKSLKETNTQLRQAYKGDLENLSNETEKVMKNAENAKSNYDRTVASLTAQNSQLKKRVESIELAAKKGTANPFATKADGANSVSTPADALIKPINIAKEYAIMEITGKGDDLYVKLINKAGDSFVAKTGTVLQTGHMVEEITPSYVQFDRNGLKDFLYTSMTSLNVEPNKMTDEETVVVTPSEKKNPALPNVTPSATQKSNLIGDDEFPSLGSSMFVK